MCRTLVSDGAGLIALGTNESKLVLVDDSLNVLERRPLHGTAGGIAYRATTRDFFVSEKVTDTGDPASLRLERLHLGSSESTVIAQASGDFAGPVFADSVAIVWALAAATQVRALESGKPNHDLTLCGDVRSLAATPRYLFAVCLTGAKFAVLDRVSGALSLFAAGGYPAAVAVRPES